WTGQVLGTHEDTEDTRTLSGTPGVDANTSHLGGLPGAVQAKFVDLRLMAALDVRNSMFGTRRSRRHSSAASLIARDADSHTGGAWKVARSVEDLASKKTRTGTYNADLSVRIGD
ncbi:MAG: toxin C-terminal domain-containing protein, partial [Xanthomonadales bacterium]|nr:toxin C-terminal domain-containing protein [Xanthomonadales bacterium]